MTGLIINADDLGYSREINEAIFDLIDKRLVTSATLLANSPAFEDAARTAVLFPRCSFGVHLNITEFEPLLGKEDWGPLLQQDGTFGRKLPRGLPVRRICHLILREWLAQIEKVRSAGITVSHLDSHHHVHTLPALFLTLCRLLRRSGVPAVRITRNLYSSRDSCSRLRLGKKSLWNSCLRLAAAPRTTEAFTDFTTFVEEASLRDLPLTSVEVETHPGSPAYAQETLRLCEDWQKSLRFPVVLTNYLQL